jgi:hypothetical protein
MIASTNTAEDKPYQKQKQDTAEEKSKQTTETLQNELEIGKAQKLPTWCRLCKFKNSVESRKHLLTNCPSTIHCISSFSEDIKLIDIPKYEEFCSLDSENRWLWILGGGFFKDVPDLNSRDFRRIKSTCPFIEGPSVSQGINKDNPQDCREAYLH